MQKREGKPWVLLPLGFKFQPTYEDLVSGYLLPKCRGENLPFEFITFSDDVYEKPPSEFCTDSTAFFGDDNIAKHYFFTELNRAKERANRTVGSYGYWHETLRKKIENNNNEIIGYRKLLNFKLKGSKNNTGWSMHEFSLCLNEGESRNLVLCVIQNNEEKRTGSCLVLGLDSGSGSGRLKIARVKSYSVDSGSPMSCFDHLDLSDGIYTDPHIAKEITEAERGTGGLDHHLADDTVPQFEITEAERGTGGLDHHLADDTVSQFDEVMVETEWGTGGPDHYLAAPQLGEDTERWMQGLPDHQIDPRFLLDSTTTANEKSWPAQYEETQQSKMMRYNP